MANLFRDLKPQAHLSKNGFDLSQRHLYTQVCGELLPTLCIDCVPGDKHVIDLSTLTRSIPMNSAAFVRVKQYHHFFFVPYSILWSNWDAFITQRGEKTSANANNSKFVPNFQRANVYTLCNSTDAKDIFGYGAWDRAKKLLDMLGYGNVGDSSSSEPVLCNAFRLAAYNKIWYDFYRNPYYDARFTDGTEYVGIYNFDDLECSNDDNSDIMEGMRQGNDSYRRFMFLPKYRQWKKDMLTSLLPSTQFGSVSYVPVDGLFSLTARNVGQNVDNNALGLAGSSNKGNATLNQVGVNLDSRNGYIYANPLTAIDFTQEGLTIDVLALRKAEVLQRWKETTLRAGQKALAQYDAHFGVRPRHTIDHTAEFVGGFDTNIMVDEVLQTSNQATGQGSSTTYGVGEIYGKGIAVSNNNHITFNASEFGVLMCISSFLPAADYSAFGVDKNNRLFEPFDFFTPEFQNIGLEPVEAANFGIKFNGGNYNGVVGYAPRYWNYKTALDKIHGGFLVNENDTGLFQWVAPRPGVQDFFFGLSPHTLYVNPSVLDPLFPVYYNGTVETDYFICNDYFDVKSIRPMSVLGLPNW